MASLYGDAFESEAADKETVTPSDAGPLDVPALMNHTWSFDFMSDRVYSGQRFRVLNIIDEGVREALDIVVDTHDHDGTTCPGSGAIEG